MIKSMQFISIYVYNVQLLINNENEKKVKNTQVNRVYKGIKMTSARTDEFIYTNRILI